MTLIGWSLVSVLWLGVAVACLQTTQGIYEDHIQMQQAQTRPIVLARRGLTHWLNWAQLHQFGAVPWQFRVGNLILAAIVIGLVALFTHRLGLTAWIAAGIMALHPLLIETVATLSGRAELVAAIGVITACLIATTGQVTLWRAGLSAACLAFGLLGKESAIVGLALVPLTWMLIHPKQDYGGAFVAGLALLIAVCWTHRLSASWDAMPQSAVAWALFQSGATVRLLTLSVLPIGQTIDFDYDALSRIWFVAAGISLAALAWVAAELWHGWRLLSFSLAWMLIVALPRLIVQTPKSYFNEHQFYAALVGVALAGATLYQRLEQRYAMTVEWDADDVFGSAPARR